MRPSCKSRIGSSVFSSALLGGAGLTAIAEALAGMIQRPVLVLNSELYCVAESFQAREALRKPRTTGATRSARKRGRPPRPEGGLRRRVAAQARRGRAARSGAGACGRGDRPPPTGGIPLRTHVAENDLPLIPTLERRAITHAAIAVAMEMLRLRAATEAESRVRGNFLWSLVAGIAGAPSEVATKAVLLGYDLRSEYEVAVGIAPAATPIAAARQRRNWRASLTEPFPTQSSRPSPIRFCSCSAQVERDMLTSCWKHL